MKWTTSGRAASSGHIPLIDDTVGIVATLSIKWNDGMTYKGCSSEDVSGRVLQKTGRWTQNPAIIPTIPSFSDAGPCGE